MSHPAVSVLITAFNRENFLPEAIESVLNSSFSDFEIIVVDDCSTDQTLQVAQCWAEADSRIKVYRNTVNLGDYPNRNKAASYASGKYLKYVDSDDKIYSDALRTMVEAMESYPEAGVGLCQNAPDGQAEKITILNTRDAYACHYFQKPIFFASPGQAIFRKSAFDAVGGFTEKRMVSDFEMWHKMTLRFSLLLLPQNLYWVRHHAGQEVALQNEYILDYEQIKVNYLLGNSTPFSKKEAFAIFKIRQHTVLKIFIRKLIAFQFAEAAVRRSSCSLSRFSFLLAPQTPVEICTQKCS
jgi:glycosyltransferase involved in cell wall biosynthesis